MANSRNTGTKLIIFDVEYNTYYGDSTLLRTAADWLDKNPDYTLVDITFHEVGSGKNEHTELRLYYDP